MKKNKHKATLKEQKKATKTELTDQISAALHSVIVNFSATSKKIDKLINKNAKQLVKKLAKENLALPAIAKTETPSAIAVKPTKPTVKNTIKADVKPKVESEKG